MSKKAKRRAAAKRKQAKQRAAKEKSTVREAQAHGPVVVSAKEPDHGQKVFALLKEKSFTDAREYCITWLKDDPLNVQGWNLLSLALHHLGTDAAVDAMEQSLLLDPDQPDVLNNLGVLTGEAGDSRRALSLLRKALRLRPKFAKAHGNLANLLRKIGDWKQANGHYEEAMLIEPRNVDVLSNFAALLMETGDSLRAEELLRKAVELQPTHGSSWVNLSALLNQQHRCQEALAASRKTLEFVNSPQALTNLGVALLESGDESEALHWLRTAAERTPTFASNYLFALSQSSQVTDEDTFVAHESWGVRVESGVAKLPCAVNTHHTRLRVGYVSPDFRDHVVCRYLLPILEGHDRERFEIYCYGEVPYPDDATRTVQARSDHWRNTVGSDDLIVARQIQADEIDVLVDLAGHTRGNRLGVFAHRPAPVQVTWMGYPNTTGLRRIDYFLSNEFLNPPEFDQYYTERVWRLPRNSTCHLRPDSDLQPNNSPARVNGWVTFGSLHRPNKVTEQSLDLWAEVLRSVKLSRLIMFFPTLVGEVADRFRSAWKARGIAPDRVEIRSQASERGYLEQYHEIDIALDVNPWTGGTTIRDACWMGVAPIAWCGAGRSARGSADVLECLGLSHLTATSTIDYVSLAESLANDLDQLERLRCELRERVERQLCNASEFLRDFESAIVAMYGQALDNRKNASS